MKNLEIFRFQSIGEINFEKPFKVLEKLGVKCYAKGGILIILEYKR